jgi:hypothetical protein
MDEDDRDRDRQQQPQVQQQQQQPSPPQQQQQVHPDDDMLESFKTDVRTWLEVDTSIRTLQASIRDRRQAKRELSNRIMSFMSRYNIEDLSTRDGCLRFHVTYARMPLSHQAIRSRIESYYAADAEAAQELSGAVFGNRDRAERTVLRRMQMQQQQQTMPAPRPQMPMPMQMQMPMQMHMHMPTPMQMQMQMQPMHTPQHPWA